LQTQNLPPHTHQLFASTGPDAIGTPTNNMLPTYANAATKFYSTTTGTTPMAANSIGLTGSSIPVNTQSPGLALTWCIATTGIFPSRP